MKKSIIIKLHDFILVETADWITTPKDYSEVVKRFLDKRFKSAKPLSKVKDFLQKENEISINFLFKGIDILQWEQIEEKLPSNAKSKNINFYNFFRTEPIEIDDTQEIIDGLNQISEEVFFAYIEPTLKSAYLSTPDQSQNFCINEIPKFKQELFRYSLSDFLLLGTVIPDKINVILMDLGITDPPTMIAFDKIMFNGSNNFHGDRASNLLFLSDSQYELDGLITNSYRFFYGPNHTEGFVVSLINVIVGFNNNTIPSILLPVLEIETFIQYRTGNKQYLPIEYFHEYFCLIQRITDLGIVVVLPAGNGGHNLDEFKHPWLQNRNPNPLPDILKFKFDDSFFTESGAIMVGACNFETVQTLNALWQKKSNSNFGKRVDAFLWGNNVCTIDSSGSVSNNSAFGDTSLASTIMTGIVANMQSILKQTPQEVRKQIINNSQKTIPNPDWSVSFEMPNLNSLLSTLRFRVYMQFLNLFRFFQ